MHTHPLTLQSLVQLFADTSERSRVIVLPCLACFLVFDCLLPALTFASFGLICCLALDIICVLPVSTTLLIKIAIGSLLSCLVHFNMLE